MPDFSGMGTRWRHPLLALTVAILAACSGSSSGSGPDRQSRPPGPVASVVSSLHLRATPTSPGSDAKVPRRAAVTSARRWLVRVGAWRSTAHLWTSLVRFTDFGRDDEPAWLVYVTGVIVPWTGQPHILVVIDAADGTRLGDYVF
jgi:hypothetical protein